MNCVISGTNRIRCNHNSPTKEERRKAEEWPSIRNRLAEAKAYVQMSRSNREKGTLQLPLILLLVVLVSIVGVIGDQWLVVGMGICIAVVAVLLRLRKRSDDPSQQLSEMERFVDEYAGQEAMMEALSEKVNAFGQKQSRLSEGSASYRAKNGRAGRGIRCTHAREGTPRHNHWQDSFLHTAYGRSRIPVFSMSFSAWLVRCKSLSVNWKRWTEK